MAENLKAAAFSAGLSPVEKKKVDDYNKSLKVHRELLNLPPEVATTVYNNKPANQKKILADNYGTEDPQTKPSRGWLGTAWAYTGGAIKEGFTLGLAGLQNVSDVTTRVYRAVAIPLSQGEIGFAWDEANDKGDKVFNEGRIEDAKAKFGQAAVDVAIRISRGETAAEIAETATPEQLKYLRLADKKQGLEKDQTTKKDQADRDLFQDTLDAVNAAKFSPGRQLANLILPASMEGSGFFYKAISGVTDAAYRIAVDPLLVAGKAKRLYDIKKYAVEVLVGDTAKGGTKLAEYFAKPAAINFWDEYGANLNALNKARASKNVKEAIVAENNLKRLAPEFGPAVIKDMMKADLPVVDALTAKAYFENAAELGSIMTGSIGRRRVLAPRLDVARKARVTAATTANKVFNIDRMGSRFVNDLFYGAPSTTDGVMKQLVDGVETISTTVKARTPGQDVGRFSMEMINYKIDKFKAKFTTIPFFKDDVLDVTAVDAPEQMYRLARLVLPKAESRVLASSFAAIEDVNARKDAFYGLWSTIADIRGLKATEPGQLIVRQLTGKGQTRFSVGRYGKAKDGSDIAIIPSDNSTLVSAPSVADIDRAATRSGLIQRMAGLANNEWVEKMTAGWSFLTLAGPRYALRNATEDLMVNLAIGETAWGLGKGRILSTRLNTARGLEKGLTKAERIAANPLGAVLRILNKKEAESFAKRMDDVDDVIAKTREEIKTLNNTVKSTTDEAVKNATKARIAELKASIKGGPVQQRRVIMAQALNEGKLNRAYKRLGIKAPGQLDKELLAEQILHGDLDNALADIVEGGKNFAVGIDYVSRAVNFTRQHGVRSVALRIETPRPYTRAKGSIGYQSLPLGTQNEASMVAWLMRIGYYSNDELGAIAIANLSDTPEGKVIAVKKIFDWLDDPKNKKVVDAFRLETNGYTKQEHAEIVYKAARELFEKQNKELNLDLLNKVRQIDDKTGEYVVRGKLSLDDLPDNDLDIPEYVVGPQLVAVSDTGNYTSSLMEKGWTWLGLSNARLSREPLALAEMIRIRKDMRKSGFEDAFIQSFIKNVDPTNAAKVEKATDLAKQKLAQIVEDRARLQILDYVDNPMVRSQLAFGVRNFARFYRATEDFYRRMYRVVRYNPEAIVKAGLTYEGITHSGWIQQDDQGESYFVYPGIEPVYRAVQGAMTAVGIPAEFRVPLPVQFGAQVKMITPSLNPDSIVPTFAGPLSGVSMKVVTNLIGFAAPGTADTITQMTMGKYAVDQSMVSAFLPAHINRLYAAMDRDERDSQYASAWRKSVTYLEASGNGVPKKYNPDGTLIPPTAAELEAYRIKVKNTTIGILGTRFVFGFFAPASPQVQLKSDMAEWVRDNGSASFKQVWNDLLDKYPGDYDKAMEKWVELYPDQIPFTVTESKRSTVAYFRYAEESGAFVAQNEQLFKQYPQAAAFLIPHKAGFSWDAYKTMKDMGLRTSKRVEDYLLEVQTATDLQTYYDKKGEYEKNLEMVPEGVGKTALREEFNSWKEIFFAGRPLVPEQLSQGGQKAVERLKALDDLRAMLNDTNVKVKPLTQAALNDMLRLYDNYKEQKQQLELVSGSRNAISALKDQTILQIKILSDTNENTKAAYNVLFGSLLGE
jgi:hypothetical protein